VPGTLPTGRDDPGEAGRSGSGGWRAMEGVPMRWEGTADGGEWRPPVPTPGAAAKA